MSTVSRHTRAHGQLPRLAFYLRRSEEETGHNYSIETQERACRERADRLFGPGGYSLVGLFADPGRSGRLGLAKPGMSDRKCRQQLTALVELIDRDQLDGVILYKLDRLARKMRLLLELLDDHFLPHGVDLYAAGEDLDIVSAQGRFTVQLLGIVAEWYSTQAAERTRDGIRNRLAQGYAIGRGCYGWRLQTAEEAKGGRRTLTRVPEEGRWLLHMKERVLSGWGSQRVAKELTRLGVPTKTGKGTTWYPGPVYTILENPLHAGLLRVNGELTEANFSSERYWDRDTYEQLCAEIGRRREVPKVSQGATQYLLLEILRCEGCGKRLYGREVEHKAGLVTHYWCRTFPTQPGCHRSVIGASRLENAVIAELQRISQSEEMQALTEEAVEALLDAHEGDLQLRAQQLSQREGQLESQLDKWAEQLTTGHVSQVQFDRFNAQLWGQLEACRTELAEAKRALELRAVRRARYEEVRRTLQDFAGIWSSLDEPQQRHLVGLLIESLTLEWRGRDSVLWLKPVGLPVRELIVQVGRVRSPDQPGRTESVLTTRHYAVLHLLDQGLSRREVCQRMGLGMGTLTTYLTTARRVSGIKELPALLEWARPLIAPRLPVLTLAGEGRRGRSPYVFAPNDVLLRALQMRAETGASLVAIAKQLDCKYTNLKSRLNFWSTRLNLHGTDELVAEAQKRGWIPTPPTAGAAGTTGDTQAEGKENISDAELAAPVLARVAD